MVTRNNPLNSNNSKKQPIILVIEDEEIMREACSDILSEEGYRVELAEDGLIGVEKAKNIRPDMALVDIRMPGIDGIEVIKRITEIDPDIVLVVITGYATVEYAVESMKSGAYDFLPKPFSPTELRMIVERGIEKRRLVAEKERLQEEKKRLEEFFISIVSHQLQTPLVAVKQYFEVILGEMTGEVTGETRDLLTRADKRLDELLALIRSWLTFARLDPEKIKDNFAPLDIVAILKHHIKFLDPIIKERDINVELDFIDDIPKVMGDERAIGEVFSNLISNAVKYNRKSGKLKIGVGVEDNMCSISFEDTGIGISEKDIPLIFSEFFRVKSKETSEIKGTGLGLNIVKKFVEAHDGTIDVKSTYGSGSKFTVHLPISIKGVNKKG